VAAGAGIAAASVVLCAVVLTFLTTYRRIGYVSVYDIDLQTLAGKPASLGGFAGSTVLVVNVASKCGLTPQYAGLQRLYDRFAEQGFIVAGFPCNQFGEQEPGTAGEITEFCSVNYGVTFPMFAKIDVNGPERHPLYTELTEVPDAEGKAGDIQWNFEKFLIDGEGNVVARFRPLTEPESPEVVEAIEGLLTH
jgi:glutathione peroxidase